MTDPAPFTSTLRVQTNQIEGMFDLEVVIGIANAVPGVDSLYLELGPLGVERLQSPNIAES